MKVDPCSLQPANPTMDPIYVEPDQVEVQGQSDDGFAANGLTLRF